jgi:hypothetical protein
MEYYRGMLITALLLSGWVFVCPWFIEDAAVSPASWSFYVAGGVGVVLASMGLVRSEDFPGYGLVAVGAWLAFSPWILGLSPAATRQAVLYGIVLAGLGWIGRPSYTPKSSEG